MKAKNLRIIIPIVILVLAGIGYVVHTGFGNLSAIGWKDISILCPIGALGTMIASKTIIPRAVVSIVIAIILFIIFGRAFCAWACPVPLWDTIRRAFSKQPKEVKEAQKAEARAKAEAKHSCKGCSDAPSNSRYIVLIAALVSTLIFGFPVFCLVCPVGLSFAFIFVLINLFTVGDVTWSIVIIPVVIILETVLFKKWCSHICPISALMSLVSKLNKTFKVKVDTNSCVEKNGGSCGKCSQVCEVKINPRHPELGADFSECTKCHACIDSCPSKAISLALFKKSDKGEAVSKEN